MKFSFPKTFEKISTYCDPRSKGSSLPGAHRRRKLKSAPALYSAETAYARGSGETHM